MTFVESVLSTFRQFRWLDALIAIGIFLLFLAFRRLFVRYLYVFLMKKFDHFRGIVTTLEAFKRPLEMLFVLLGAYFGVRYFLGDTWNAQHWLRPFFRTFTIALVGWAIYQLSASSSFLLTRIGKQFGQDSTSMLIPFLSRFLRVLVVLLTLAAVVSEWGFNVNGIVAGMGLGSLAIALAAQSTLGNIFGGVVLILEKPFVRGDWIQTPETQGIVEDITFRSTKIRTFDDSVVIIPNSKIADQSITNWSQMGRRRINFNLEVALDSDPERLRAAVRRMQREFESDSNVDESTVQVKFNAFSATSLRILFNGFTKTTVWADYLVTAQEINLMILRVLREEGIKLAFPAQRVLFEGEGVPVSPVEDTGAPGTDEKVQKQASSTNQTPGAALRSDAEKAKPERREEERTSRRFGSANWSKGTD